jgi:apolipoprotein N-acyltransferase
MIEGIRSSPTRRFVIDFGILAVSALVFSLSFPSFISTWGYAPLAYISLAAIPLVLRRNGYLATSLLGMLYGYGSYALFNFWLAKFHPLAHIIVPVIYGAYFLLLFPLLKLADDVFPKYGFIVQCIIWLAFEYVRTLGFIGYSYGILGYSQYLFLPLARFASIAGVFGVSAFVAFPSFLLGRCAIDGVRTVNVIRGFWESVKRHRLYALAYLLLFTGALIYGIGTRGDYSDARSWRVALIQQNVDPWHGGTRAFRKGLDIHIAQSLEAIKENPDIVIWSETAFVPSISWHTRFRTDRDRYLLVQELTEFLQTQDVPYVIGNGDGQLEVAGREPVNPDGSWNRKDYNAVLLYENGEIQETYRKLHLVPFTESFPFKKQLPGIYSWLEAADTHFWEKGDEYVVFETDGISFSTPICYEDTFGNLSRAFVRAGAEVIVNITNDSWSASVAAEMQHMAMSVFRAIENRRTVVRGTNGGITCTIDPSGRILDRLAPFIEDYLVSDVPVYSDTRTLYTRFGDWFGIGCVLLAIAFLGTGVTRRFLLHRRTIS